MKTADFYSAAADNAVSFSTKDSSTAASLCGKGLKVKNDEQHLGSSLCFVFGTLKKNISKLFFVIGH